MSTILKHVFALIFLFASAVQADVITHFNQIKTDKTKLQQFLQQMPKGGELHFHLPAALFAEELLTIAQHDDSYILDNETLTIAHPPALSNNFTKIDDIKESSTLYTDIIKAWSMKDFIAGKESGHDHFFNSFRKFIIINAEHRSKVLAQILRHAAKQNILYLEVMDTMDNLGAIGFGDLIKDQKTWTQKRDLLLSDKKFQANIQKTKANTDKTIKEAHELLGCQQNPNQDACKIKVTFQYHGLREQTFNNLFAQMLNAFEAASSKDKQASNTIVGVNLVQPEDGPVSLKDYHKHMKLFEFFHRFYPEVNIALHAGELTPEFAPPKDLSFHIYEALFTGKAQRIGHGVDITYETYANEILKYMATQHIPVEINFSSNQAILNMNGQTHPFKYYLAHHVPVVLSTDDQGILRTNLTNEYLIAVQQYGIDYPTLKLINRNALTYSFLPGSSIWTDAEKGLLVSECKILESQNCKKFINANEKAKLQWQLEKELIDFEKGF